MKLLRGATALMVNKDLSSADLKKITDISISAIDNNICGSGACAATVGIVGATLLKKMTQKVLKRSSELLLNNKLSLSAFTAILREEGIAVTGDITDLYDTVKSGDIDGTFLKVITIITGDDFSNTIILEKGNDNELKQNKNKNKNNSQGGGGGGNNNSNNKNEKNSQNGQEKTGVVYKTDTESTKAAAKMGYRPTNEFSMGRRIYKKGDSYITADRTGHNGGAWKVAKNTKDLRRAATRETWSAGLKEMVKGPKK